MANAVLTTKLSRRTMLAGGASAALPAAALSAAASAFAAPPGAAGTCGPDAELLRRIAAAARLWDDYTTACERCTRLFAALRHHPDWPAEPYSEAGCWAVEALAVRTGYRVVDDYCEQVYERHDAAMHAAYRLPALTLPGLRAKLRYALKAAKDRDFGTFEESDYRWLDIAMADMDRLTGREYSG